MLRSEFIEGRTNWTRFGSSGFDSVASVIRQFHRLDIINGRLWIDVADIWGLYNISGPADTNSYSMATWYWEIYGLLKFHLNIVSVLPPRYAPHSLQGRGDVPPIAQQVMTSRLSIRIVAFTSKLHRSHSPRELMSFWIAIVVQRAALVTRCSRCVVCSQSNKIKLYVSGGEWLCMRAKFRNIGIEHIINTMKTECFGWLNIANATSRITCRISSAGN